MSRVITFISVGLHLLVYEIYRNSAIELGETILPPPELFDTERCCSSLGNDQTLFLLPPPAGFDSVSRSSSTADLPLPPPPLFFDVDCGSPTTSADFGELCSRLPGLKSPEVPDVIQRNSLDADGHEQKDGDVEISEYNGINSIDDHVVNHKITEATKDTVNNEDFAKSSCNGVGQSGVTTTRVTSDADESLLVPVSTASGKPASVKGTNHPRFARDAMDKLDALCRSQEGQTVGPPSSSAIAIPVLHETTPSSAGGKVQRQRSVGQSWSDGLFFWDVDDTMDKSSKRHSAGASLSDMVVGGGLGARPKIPMLKSRSAFDSSDWRRRPGVMRAQSAGVISPHRHVAGRRLLTRYTPDGREFCVHSKTSRVEVKEELRHRSLEPDDTESSTMSSVLSDSSLPSTSTELCSRVDETRRFFSQQCLSTTHSSDRKNLLEQASERRKASRMMPKLGLTSVIGSPSSLTAQAETPDTEVPVAAEEVTGGRPGPVRGLVESSLNVDDPVTSKALPLTSAERSMETIKVPRPPSLVVRSSKSEPGSPVRVLVADSPPQSEDDAQTTSADDDVEAQARPSLSRSAPLCSPEPSFDAASEIPSGRNSPANTSVSTFQGNFSETALTAGDDLTAAETSTTSTTAAEHHFIVVAIDFGTTYSGYAFSFVRDPDSVHMMRRWEGGDPGVVNQKTPTTLLLDPAGKFHSFGYAARDSYHDLDTQEAKKWLYFDKFKMVLHHNAVSTLSHFSC